MKNKMRFIPSADMDRFKNMALEEILRKETVVFAAKSNDGDNAVKAFDPRNYCSWVNFLDLVKDEKISLMLNSWLYDFDRKVLEQLVEDNGKLLGGNINCPEDSSGVFDMLEIKKKKKGKKKKEKEKSEENTEDSTKSEETPQTESDTNKN